MNPTTQTLWDTFWDRVGNEEWLAAKELLDISPRVAGFFAAHLRRDTVELYDDNGNPCGVRDDLVLDWEAAAEHIATEGFSSTEDRLARLVSALTTGTPYPLADLTAMGSWSEPVWLVLVAWGPDHPLTGIRFR